MKITDLLDPRSISLDAAPTSKSETLDKAVELMAASGKLSDVEAFRKQVYAREEESTTGIGEGIAIPHGKCDAVKKPGLAAMVIKNGVDFDSLDGEPVTLLFLIAAPNTKERTSGCVKQAFRSHDGREFLRFPAKCLFGGRFSFHY